MPGSVTEAETFLWYRAHPRLQFGAAYLHKQGAFRWLASANLLPETETAPGINASAGVQGIGTGNPGYALTAEKKFGLTTAYTGIGFRSNENRGRLIGGIRHQFAPQWNIGFQADGKQEHAFVTHDLGEYLLGFYLIDLDRPGFMVGFRF